QNIFARVNEHGPTRPVNFVAAAEGDEHENVVRQRPHAGFGIRTASVERMQHRIIGNALLEFFDGSETTGKKSEIQRTIRSVSQWSSRGFALRSGGGRLGHSGFLLRSGIVLWRPTVEMVGSEENSCDQNNCNSDDKFLVHVHCLFFRYATQTAA